ncbi:DUF3189 family protein [Calderihabitans maritimus]|uniref:DUF3189 domain-containing protein n=1 Tax=Calderihabitans maritimus TaxID=1246530 RepID=A0A1Z5HV76_9FIRM|nr:DUF3189 family protein [Calderihabitans maritimus]GAW93235.1 hypothetical protein TepRe1_1158 [Calderihabitans maritimus]
MRIIYYCSTGVHLAALMAAIHLGHIPAQVKIKPEQVNRIEWFDLRLPASKAGSPFFVGRDEQGHEVFTMAVGNERLLAPKTIRGFLNLCGIPAHDLLLVDAQKYATFGIKLGSYLQRLGLRALGRSILVNAICQVYPNCVRQVMRVKEELGSGPV